MFSFELFLHFSHLHKGHFVNVVEALAFFAEVITQGLYWRLIASEAMPGRRNIFKLILKRV